MDVKEGVGMDGSVGMDVKGSVDGSVSMDDKGKVGGDVNLDDHLNPKRPL